jgi:hypothetical protein
MLVGGGKVSSPWSVLIRLNLGLYHRVVLTKARPMSERSIYLRDQAAKCRRHASAMTDPYRRAELQKLAAEYIERATEIESKEKAA